MKYLLLVMAVMLSLPADAQSRKTRRLQAPAVFEAAAINDSNQGGIGPNAKGSGVVRAQILLDRAHFSCGEIDGNYGSNLEKTVSAFQRARDLPVNGAVGPETWAA